MNPTDTDARFNAAMAGLINPSTAQQWLDSVRQIELAARSGHAAASERCALFECMGMGHAPNWTGALDWLAAAAERGSAQAYSQLLVLADDDYRSPTEALAKGQPATELRSRIDLRRRLSAGRATALSLQPQIHAIPAFASPAECRWLIEVARPRLERASIRYSVTGESAVDSKRSNRVAPLQLAAMDVVTELVRNRLATVIGTTPACLELPQILHYAVGQEFRPHYDFLDPGAEQFRTEIARNGQRSATVLIYLNDDFDGGETQFPLVPLNYRGKTGDALFFANLRDDGQPDRSTLHAGLPPTRGEKWVFSQWVRDRPLS